MGSIWREDEGEVEPRLSTEQEAPLPNIWREDEGQVQVRSADPEVRSDQLEAGRRRPPVRFRKRLRPDTKLERSRFRRPSTYLFLLVGLAILGLIGDGAYVAVRLTSSLRTVEGALRDGRVALSEGDLDRARTLFDDASDSAEIAMSTAGHPSLRVAQLLPRIGRDADALVALARASRLGTDGARAGVDAADALGLEGSTFAQSVYDQGRVDIDALERAQPHVASAAVFLEAAATLLNSQGRPTIAPVHDALAAASASIESAADLAARSNELISALPGLLGGDGDRNYLLAFQAIGESRGTGGVVGVYGVLKAESGRLSLEKVASFEDIQQSLTGPVAAPEWFSRSYGAQRALEEWSQANLTPNFSAAARVMINMYEAARGHHLDGAIAMDPITLSRLMAATGPLEDPLTGELVAADVVDDLLLRDSYTRFDSDEQNLYLTALVNDFWEKIQNANLSSEIAVAVGDVVRSGHLKVYTSDPDEQDAMVALRADGNFASLGPATQLVFNNNYSVNKVDYFLHRTIDTTVELEAGGGATFTTRIEVENRAPSEPPSLLLGQGTGDISPGTNRMLLAAALPRGAEVERTEKDGKTLTPFTYTDSGHLVVWDLVTVSPGGTEELTFVYSVPGAPLGDIGELTLTLAPHTTVNPDLFSFELVPPPGSEVSDATGATIRKGSAFAAGELVEPRIMSFTLQQVEG